MKRIWNAKYKNGVIGQSAVYGEDADDARKAAYALYTYESFSSVKRFDIDDVVESVELAEDQTMKGNAVQQQVEYTENDPEWNSLGLNKVIAGGMEFDTVARTVRSIKA